MIDHHTEGGTDLDFFQNDFRLMENSPTKIISKAQRKCYGEKCQPMDSQYDRIIGIWHNGSIQDSDGNWTTVDEFVNKVTPQKSSFLLRSPFSYSSTKMQTQTQTNSPEKGHKRKEQAVINLFSSDSGEQQPKKLCLNNSTDAENKQNDLSADNSVRKSVRLNSTVDIGDRQHELPTPSHLLSETEDEPDSPQKNSCNAKEVKFKCPIKGCSSIVMRKVNAKRHLRDYHGSRTSDGKFVRTRIRCLICSKLCLNESNFGSHHKLKHTAVTKNSTKIWQYSTDRINW